MKNDYKIIIRKDRGYYVVAILYKHYSQAVAPVEKSDLKEAKKWLLK